MKRIKLDGGAVYHCIGRIVGGEMKMGDAEKEFFRKLMWRVADFCGVEVITYCVMSNHVHLMIRVPRADAPIEDGEVFRRMVKYYGRREPWVQLAEKTFREEGKLPAQIRDRMLSRMGDISPFMQTLKQRFARWYNRRHKRFGTLWAERFKSLLVEESDEALLTVAMYVDLNPVRAGLVKDPKDYRFCGHAEAVAGNKAARRTIVSLSDAPNWRASCAEYRSQMMVYAGDSNRRDKRALSREEVLQVLRRGGQVPLGEVLRLRIRYLSDGVALGSKEFVESVFHANKERFGRSRSSGAREMKSLAASRGGLATARDLRSNVVG